MRELTEQEKAQLPEPTAQGVLAHGAAEALINELYGARKDAEALREENARLTEQIETQRRITGQYAQELRESGLECERQQTQKWEVQKQLAAAHEARWEQLFANTTPEQWEKLEQRFRAEETEGVSPLDFEKRQAEGEWVSVEERLPKEGKSVLALLVGTPSPDIPEVLFYEGGAWYDHFEERSWRVTLWRDLPPLPGPAGGEE